jgi:hypothetical protein
VGERKIATKRVWKGVNNLGKKTKGKGKENEKILKKSGLSNFFLSSPEF